MVQDRPTSRDVAAAANVSVATVSYVMNGRTDRRIPQSTRDRVLAAAQELGYVPNRAARSLRRRRTEQVCLIIGSLGVPAYDQLAQNLHEAADAVGYGVITMVANTPRLAAKAVERLNEGIADGVMVARRVLNLRQSAWIALANRGMPLVAMSNTAEPDGFDVVRAPEAGAVGEAIDRFVELGRRRIAFIGHGVEVSDYRRSQANRSERLGAYLDALERHGIAAEDALIVPGADSRVDTYETVLELLGRSAPPDAIFSASARGAVSALWAARDLGVAVPDALAIVGAGDLPEVRITRPSLSMVGPPQQEDYAEAARLLFERVTADEPIPGREISTPWVFTVRGSS